jgi:hypothetical protein
MVELVFHPCQLELVEVEDRDQSRIRTGKGLKANCRCIWILHVVAPRVYGRKIMLIL